MKFKTLLKRFIAITLTASMLPILPSITDLKASTIAPTWTTAEQRTGSTDVYLNWDVKIPDSDIFFTEDFESKTFNYTTDPEQLVGVRGHCVGWLVDGYGNNVKDYDRCRSLVIGSGFGINNSRGLNLHNTYGHGAHYIPYPEAGLIVDTSTINMSAVYMSNGDTYDWKLVKPDRKAVFKIKAKGKGSANIAGVYDIDGNAYKCSLGNGNITWGEDLSADEFWNRLVNGTPIKMNNPDGDVFGDCWGVTRTCEVRTADYPYKWFWGYNYKDASGQWWFKCKSVNPEPSYHSKPGQVISSTRIVDPIYNGAPFILGGQGAGFGRDFDIDSDTFQEFSLDANIPRTNMYNYYGLQIYGSSPTDLYIDDISVGYAQKSRLHRNGVELTLPDNGYTVEYTDRNAYTLDTEKPSINNQTLSYNPSTRNMKFSWSSVQDTGVYVKYEVESVNSDNQASARVRKDVPVVAGVNKIAIYNNGTEIANQTDMSKSSVEFPLSLASGDLTYRVYDRAGNYTEGNLDVANISEILPISDITSTKYSSVDRISLPTAVNVKTNLSGDSTDTIGVSWDTSNFDSTKNEVTLNGTLQLPAGMRNTLNLQPTLRIVFNDYQVTDAGKITNFPIDNHRSISTLYKVQPDLTSVSKASIRINESFTKEVDIDWDLSTLDVNTISTQTIQGTLNSNSLQTNGLVNSGNITVSLDIDVTKPDIVSIETIPVKIIPAYAGLDSLSLPESLDVKFQNNEVISCHVDWETSTFDDTQLGDQQLIGTIEIPENYINTLDLKAVYQFVVSKANIESIEEPNSSDTTNKLYQEVEYGTSISDIEIPTSIKVNTGTSIQEVNVVFDTSTYNCFNLGEQEFEGVFIYNSEQLTGLENFTPKMIIKVVPTFIKTLFTPNRTIRVPIGTDFNQFELKDETSVILNSGAIINIPTAWDGSEYKNYITSQTLNGIFTLPNGVTNPRNIEITTTINMFNVIGGTPEIINFVDNPIIEVPLGADIGYIPFKQKVKAYLNSGGQGDIDVLEWDTEEIDTSRIGTYNAKAQLTTNTPYANPRGLMPIQQIRVVDTYSENDIVQLVPLEPIQVMPGDTITLPSKQIAVKGDGTVEEVNVSFTHVDTNTVGVYHIEGTLLSGPNPLNLVPTLEVDVIDLDTYPLDIVYVTEPSMLIAPMGTSVDKFSFTGIVKARLSNNMWVNLTAVPQLSSYDSTSLETQVFDSTLTLPPNIENSNRLESKVRIRLFDLTEQLPTISKVINPSSITVLYQTPYEELVLPPTKVILSNGKITNIPTVWAMSNYKPDYVGLQDFNGELRGRIFISDDISEKPLLNVRVLPDVRDIDGSHTIVGLHELSNIECVKGRLLDKSDLPNKVLADFRDGSTKEVNIKLDYSSKIINYSETVNGEVDLDDNTYITCSPNVRLMIVATNNRAKDSGNSSGGSSTNVKGESSDKNNDVKSEVNQIVVPENNNLSGKEIKLTVKDEIDLLLRGKLKLKELSKDAKLYLVKNTAEYIPYTLPKDKLIEWGELLDTRFVQITSDTFKDDDVVKVSMSCVDVQDVQTSKVISPIKTMVSGFKDVPNTHWAYNSIMKLNELGYAKGSDDGRFLPKESISVADTFVFLDRILVNHNKLGMRNSRSSIDKIGLNESHWAYYNVASILSKVSKGRLNSLINQPNLYNVTLTRQDVAVYLYDILSYLNIPTENTIGHSSFKDKQLISNLTAVDYCVNLGLFYGDDNGNFNPNNKITRAELVSVLIRLDDILQ